MITGVIKNTSFSSTENKNSGFNTLDFYGLRVGDKVILASNDPIFKENIGEIIEINREYVKAWNEGRKRLEQIKVQWLNNVIDTHTVAELERLPTIIEAEDANSDWYNYL